MLQHWHFWNDQDTIRWSIKVCNSFGMINAKLWDKTLIVELVNWKSRIGSFCHIIGNTSFPLWAWYSSVFTWKWKGFLLNGWLLGDALVYCSTAEPHFLLLHVIASNSRWQDKRRAHTLTRRAWVCVCFMICWKALACWLFFADHWFNFESLWRLWSAAIVVAIVKWSDSSIERKRRQDQDVKVLYWSAQDRMNQIDRGGGSEGVINNIRKDALCTKADLNCTRWRLRWTEDEGSQTLFSMLSETYVLWPGVFRVVCSALRG